MTSGSHHVALTTVGNFIPALVGLITAPLLAQGLGAEGRGELAAVTAPLFLLVSAATLGMPEAITYFVAKRFPRPHRTVLVGIVWLAAAGLTGSALIAALSIALIPDSPELRTLMTLAGCALAPSLIVGGIRGAASGLQLWSLVAAERIISATTRLIWILTLSLTGTLTVGNVTLAMAATPLIGALVYLRLAHKLNSISTTAGSGVSLTGYGARVWIGAIAGILLSRLDQLLMTPLSTFTQLGLYVVAVTVSEAALIFNASVREVLFSSQSQSQSHSQQSPSPIQQASRISTIVTLGIAILIGTSATWLIPLLFGEDFAKAVPVIWVLLAGIVLGNPGSIAGVGLSASGRPGLRSLSLVVALILNVALVSLLVPGMGAMGAAIATLAGNIVSGFLNVVWMRKITGSSVSGFYSLRANDVRNLIRLVRLR